MYANKPPVEGDSRNPSEQNNENTVLDPAEYSGLNMADSLQVIANAHGIDSGKFIRFWSTRFGDNPDLSYATTWAKRIRDQDPRKQIDNKSLNAMIKAGFDDEWISEYMEG